MKLERLRGRKVCTKVLKDGNLWRGKHMFIRWMTGVPRGLRKASGTPAIYVGLLASSKLHKSAVKRNRMRRRCREALRTILKEDPGFTFGSLQVLIAPRLSSETAAFSEIQADIRSFLTSHGRRS